MNIINLVIVVHIPLPVVRFMVLSYTYTVAIISNPLINITASFSKNSKLREPVFTENDIWVWRIIRPVWASYKPNQHRTRKGKRLYVNSGQVASHLNISDFIRTSRPRD